MKVVVVVGKIYNTVKKCEEYHKEFFEGPELKVADAQTNFGDRLIITDENGIIAEFMDWMFYRIEEDKDKKYIVDEGYRTAGLQKKDGKRPLCNEKCSLFRNNTCETLRKDGLCDKGPDKSPLKIDRDAVGLPSHIVDGKCKLRPNEICNLGYACDACPYCPEEDKKNCCTSK